jgi:hypothetical protein
MPMPVPLLRLHLPPAVALLAPNAKHETDATLLYLCVFLFILNLNLYSAARTTQHRGGHVCKDVL